MNKKRIIIATIIGAILGVFCIVGATVRFGGSLSTMFLFWFWFNRVIMGLVFGLLPLCDHPVRRPIRAIIVGLAVSFVFYAGSGFHDMIGFFAGGLYGLIIEYGTEYIMNRQKTS